jgi:hypothetical protein
VIILVNGATRTVEQYPQLGRLISPRAGNSIDGIATSGRLWAADNDAFGGAWDQERFWRMLARIARVDRSRLLFVTCPDVVCSAQATVNRWVEWHPQIEAIGLPAAFVGQNGLGAIPDQIPWHEMAAFFIGGDDAWKLSAEAEHFAHEARARGKWVHWGRVNSEKRIRHAIEVGGDSIDGRSFSGWPDINIPKGLRWIRRAERQPHFHLPRSPAPPPP